MKTAPLIGISRHRLTTDGEGVTTLVAFHGCPLRCKYCLNPQSLHSEGIWKHYDCMQLYEEVRLDELYFLATHGGITFGGGEPCLQSDFIYEFRQLCGQEWQLSVESSLNVPQENIEKLLPVIDYYIIDIKDINNDIYQQYTGKENEKVLNNLHYLIEHGKNEQIIVRTPIILVYNSESDVDNSIRLLKEMGITQFDRFTYKTLNTYQP
ncbi:radical SAM protein [Bacteroides faecis]|uniref:radical SAM protein n=1 Tax=Bacteroides faecis TaxID=674529 RepID=UPI002166885C|nr:radical SAM protein [Bacteroides faecis]MCS3068395.1 radical SAM protein [Bacteroides faecis]